MPKRALVVRAHGEAGRRSLDLAETSSDLEGSLLGSHHRSNRRRNTQMAATVSKSTTDLVAARATASFNPAKLNALLNEGSRDAEMRQRVSKIIAEDPVFDKSKK